MLFAKAPNIVIGPGDAIEIPYGLSEQIDYECELGVVIGTPGFRIPRTEAKNHIFGYTIVNDVTARDLQRGDKQWFRGKSCNTFAPMGPSWSPPTSSTPPTRRCPAQGQRRSPPEVQHERPDLRRPVPDRVHQRGLPAGGGRRHLDRHAGRRGDVHDAAPLAPKGRPDRGDDRGDRHAHESRAVKVPSLPTVQITGAGMFPVLQTGPAP